MGCGGGGELKAMNVRKFRNPYNHRHARGGEKRRQSKPRDQERVHTANESAQAYADDHRQPDRCAHDDGPNHSHPAKRHQGPQGEVYASYHQHQGGADSNDGKRACLYEKIEDALER